MEVKWCRACAEWTFVAPDGGCRRGGHAPSFLSVTRPPGSPSALPKRGPTPEMPASRRPRVSPEEPFPLPGRVYRLLEGPKTIYAEATKVNENRERYLGFKVHVVRDGGLQSEIIATTGDLTRTDEIVTIRGESWGWGIQYTLILFRRSPQDIEIGVLLLT